MWSNRVLFLERNYLVQKHNYCSVRHFAQRQSSTVVRRPKPSRTKVVPHLSQSRVTFARSVARGFKTGLILKCFTHIPDQRRNVLRANCTEQKTFQFYIFLEIGLIKTFSGSVNVVAALFESSTSK